MVFSVSVLWAKSIYRGGGKQMHDDARVSKKGTPKKRGLSVRAVFILLALLLIGSGSAYAFPIPTGNEDLVINWDNTVRYLLMYRVASQNDSLTGNNVTVPVLGGLGNVNGDDGDRNFDKGIVSNRLDLLSEADLVYKKSYGVRVSAAFWDDQQYHNRFDNDSVYTSNYRDENGVPTVNRLSKYADRYYAGPYGELLDAFVFAKVEVGDVPLFFKLGRHIYSWGQSLLNPYNGISYGQMPLDVAKATANPGIEAKELFRPTNTFSVIAQITPELQLAGQYFLQWERNRLPLPGTYLSTADVDIDGEGGMIVGYGGAGPVYYNHGRDVEAARNRDFGLALQWSPKSLHDTTFGLYYRRFSDRMPTLILDVVNSTYHAAYKSNIDLYGISYAGQILSNSIGAEISYRRNTPLVSSPQMILPGVIPGNALPDDGDILGATGDTLHALVNVMNLLKKSPLWDTGNWVFEFDYCRWMSVGEDVKSNVYGTSLFKGADDYTGFDRVTRDAGQITFNFTPQYLQILSGLDLDVPFTITYGLWGVSPTAGTITGEGDGTWGIGLNFTYENKYKLNFNYVSYFGRLEDSAAGAASRGNYAPYRDRDFVAMTFKVSF